MNQTDNQGTFQTMLAVGMVVLIIIIATSLIVGGQVYWWQKAAAEKERKDLQRQINSLQNELIFLREDLGKPLLQKSQNNKDETQAIDKIYMDNLAGREREVITALKNRDMTKLASLIHPEKGLRFSPFSYVDTRSDRVFSQEKIKYFFADFKKYIWGYSDIDSQSIKMNSKNYFDSFVYDCDYATADEINYNVTIGRSLTASNIFEIYPHSIIVEFGKDRHDATNKAEDWRSIRLVFEKSADDKWYLVGIAHDQWKI